MKFVAHPSMQSRNSNHPIMILKEQIEFRLASFTITSFIVQALTVCTTTLLLTRVVHAIHQSQLPPIINPLLWPEICHSKIKEQLDFYLFPSQCDFSISTYHVPKNLLHDPICQHDIATEVVKGNQNDDKSCCLFIRHCHTSFTYNFPPQ